MLTRCACYRSYFLALFGLRRRQDEQGLSAQLMPVPDMSLTKQGQYRFQNFEVDLGHRRLWRDGRPVPIATQTFDLLAFLVLRPQRVITPEQLMDSVWPELIVEEDDLNQQIFLLRKALLGAKSGEKLLVTVPGLGYQFVPQVTEIEEDEGDDEEQEEETKSEPAHSAAKDEIVEADVDLDTDDELDDADDEDEDLETGETETYVNETDSAVPVGATIVPHEPHSQDAGSLSHGRIAEAVGHDEDSDEDSLTRGSKGSSRNGRLWQAALFTAIVAALGLAAVFYWRSHRPVPESLSLVLAEVDNTTGNAEFDVAMQTALTIDLQQSQYLRIATGDQIASQLEEINAGSSQTPAPRLTPALARQVCQRLDGQVYLTGLLRGLGNKYLITIQAFNCGDGSSVATSRGVAESPDALVAVLDKVAVDLRKQLGEPSASVARFSKPLFADRGASLEALKNYADGRALRLDGKLEPALTLLQHAVEIDPQFAAAFVELGSAYAELGQRELAVSAVSRAFELRGTVDEPHRLQIVAAYNDVVTGDILASIHNYQDWSDEYPRNPIPLVRLAEDEIQIGKPALALDPAQRALKLDPADAGAYVALANTQLSMGQFEAATSTCQAAISRHLDSERSGERIHGFLLQIAFLHRDQASIDAQIAWSKGKPAEPFMTLQQALMDFAAGKAKTAEVVFADAVDGYRKQGQSESVDRALSEMPRIEAELGLTDIAHALLTHMPAEVESGESGAGDSFDIPVAWAHTAEIARAEALLKSELEAHPTSTLWQEDYALQIRAVIALNQKQPEEAIEDLKPAEPFDLRSFDVPALRGRAYLAAQKPELAEAEFRKILNHSGIEPLSYNYPLAQLGLARALALEGKTAEAEDTYKMFFAAWKDADADLPRLREAKAEYTRLAGGAVKAKPAGSSQPAGKPALAKPSVSKPTVGKH